VIFTVTAGIRPTVGAFVIAESSEEPTDSEYITIEQSALTDTDNIVKRYFSKVIVTPF
jgi:hypothetical protein